MDTIINGVINITGVVIGFFLQQFANYLSDKKRIKQELSGIKNSLYSVTIANNLFPELLKLKQFFVRNQKYLRKPENNHFFQRWLTEPLVEEAFTGVGYWNKERIEEMFRDLDKTKPK